MNRIKWLPQAILGLVLLSLSYYVYMDEGKNKEKEAEDEKKRIFTLKDKPIKSIRITTENKNFVFECTDMDAGLCKAGEHSSWRMIQPNQIIADKSHVNQLLSSINNARANDIIDLTKEDAQKKEVLLAEYQLSETMRNADTSQKIELILQDGTQFQIWLGAPHPLNNDQFLVTAENNKLNDNKIFVVPKTLASNFAHDLNYWRDKNLFTLQSHEVDSFELKGSAGNIKGQKSDGKWTLLVGSSNKVRSFVGNTEAIDSMITSAVTLTAINIAAEDKRSGTANKKLAGTENALSLTLIASRQKNKKDEGSIAAPVEKDSTQETITLKLNKRKTITPPSTKDGKPLENIQLFASVSNSDPLYEIAAASLGRLDKPMVDLRAKRLLTSIERYKANRMEISGRKIGDQPLVFVKDSSNSVWKHADSKLPPLDSEKVQGLLDKFAANHIAEFISEKQMPEKSDEDVLVISLGDNEANNRRKFEFWSKGNDLFARDLYSDSKEAYKMDNVMKSALPQQAGDFLLGKNQTPPVPSSHSIQSDDDGHDHDHGQEGKDH